MIAECFDDDVLPKELTKKVDNVCVNVSMDMKIFDDALKNAEIAFDNLNKVLKEIIDKDNVKIKRL